MSVKGQPPAATGGGDGTLGAAGSLAHPHYGTPDAKAQAPLHGKIRGDVWHKTAQASVHMLRRPAGWAVDQADALRAWRACAEYVCIRDSETGRLYWARLRDLLECAALFDRGFGPQLLWPLDRWAATRREAEPDALQLELALGGVP